MFQIKSAYFRDTSFVLNRSLYELNSVQFYHGKFNRTDNSNGETRDDASDLFGDPMN